MKWNLLLLLGSIALLVFSYGLGLTAYIGVAEVLADVLAPKFNLNEDVFREAVANVLLNLETPIAVRSSIPMAVMVVLLGVRLILDAKAARRVSNARG